MCEKDHEKCEKRYIKTAKHEIFRPTAKYPHEASEGRIGNYSAHHLIVVNKARYADTNQSAH